MVQRVRSPCNIRTTQNTLLGGGLENYDVQTLIMHTSRINVVNIPPWLCISHKLHNVRATRTCSQLEMYL